MVGVGLESWNLVVYGMNQTVGSFLKWKDGNNQGLGCPFKEKNESRSC